MSEVSERYARIADGFRERLDGVQGAQWGDPTPCTDWTVRALIVHVIETHGRVLASLGDSVPSEVDPERPLGEQWSAAAGAISDALADPELSSRTVGGMFGEQPFEMLVSRLLCADTLYHTWDLARATGQNESLDADSVARAQEFLEPLDEAIRRPGGFAAKIAAPEGADAQTRLLCFGGRQV